MHFSYKCFGTVLISINLTLGGGNNYWGILWHPEFVGFRKISPMRLMYYHNISNMIK